MQSRVPKKPIRTAMGLLALLALLAAAPAPTEIEAPAPPPLAVRAGMGDETPEDGAPVLLIALIVAGACAFVFVAGYFLARFLRGRKARNAEAGQKPEAESAAAAAVPPAAAAAEETTKQDENEDLDFDFDFEISQLGGGESAEPQ